MGNGRMKNFARLIVALGLVALSISSCTVSPADSIGGSQSLVVGHASGLVSEPYVLWADSQGYFENTRLEVENVAGGSSSERVAALIGGSLDVAAIAGTDLVQLVSNTEFDPVVLGGIHAVTAEQLEQVREQRPYSGQLLIETTIVLRADLEPQAWKSNPRLKVAVRGPQAIAALGFLSFLESESVDYSNFEFVNLSNADDALSALRRGDVDAAQLTGAYAYEALREGAHLVTYPTAYWLEPGPWIFWITSREIAGMKATQLRNFRDAFRQVARELNKGDTTQNYIAFIKDKYDLSDEAIESIIVPPLYEDPVGPEDFDYYSDQLIEAGLIDRAADIDEDNFLSE